MTKEISVDNTFVVFESVEYESVDKCHSTNKIFWTKRLWSPSVYKMLIRQPVIK